jgi:carbamoyl-phosphate synthase/aspartate carbamoyltransferase/dihydroorotase
MIKLPGLIDPHVHLREPGATHKEDWESGTKAGLAGGFTMLLAMPNTDPPVLDIKTFELCSESARKKSCIDYGIFVGACTENASSAANLAPRSAGLKMYLDQTYGPLKLESMILWQQHIKNWPDQYPLAVHAEQRSLGAVLLMSILYNKAIHICHVARKEEILLIRAAKQKGAKVTCEVAPHHLFMTEDDIPPGEPGKGEVRPRLARSEDRAALWENLDVIDCFASDHAPHTLAEKVSPNPPPGFPGLETSLYLYLNAVSEGQLSIDDLILRMETNPRKIFSLPKQAETWIDLDPDYSWEINAENTLTRCGWTPFEGWKVKGRLRRVVLRGNTAYEDGEILAKPGSGLIVRAVDRYG